MSTVDLSFPAERPAWQRSRKGLAPRLILYILLFSSVVTFFATALQLYLDYSRDLRAIDTRLLQVRNSYLKSITLSLWSLDYEQLRSQLEGIRALPDMQYLEIEVDGEPLLTVGHPDGENLLRDSYPITHRYRGQDIHLGTLHLAASLEGVYNRLRDRVLVIFGAQAVKTFLVASFIFLLFQLLVTRHLQHISHYVRSKRLGKPSPELTLRRRARAGGPDELDDVVHAFNQMCANLELSYQQLAISEERFDLAMRGANDGVWDWDLKAKRVYYSPRWKEMLGFRPDELTDTPSEWRDRLHPNDEERVFSLLQSHLTGKTAQFECTYRMRHKSGDYRWILSRGQALRNDSGSPIRMVGTHMDITEQKLAEEALAKTTRELQQEQERRLQAERLACVGELSASIAHEIRNPLSSIINSLMLITQGKLPKNEHDDVIAIVDSETARLQRILNDFLSFARLRLSEISSKELSPVIESAVNTLRMSVPADNRIEISIEFAHGDQPAQLDEDQIRQVILNLGLNAIQAMPDGGRISLTTHLALGKIWVTVRDTGEGIPEQLKDRILKPFVTGRPNGTGLGLSVVQRILTQHGSELLIKSKPGGGTMMQFALSMG